MSSSLKHWLSQYGLQKYYDVFVENDVDREVMPGLTDEDLRELGVSLGHRKKFFKAIASVDSEPPSINPETEEGAQPAPNPAVAQPPAADVLDRNSVVNAHALPLSAAEHYAGRRQLTIMFVDMVDSTKLSERLDPEDLSHVVREFQICCELSIERYGGYIARYMGDGMLVYFGYPQAKENDVQRALLTALELIDSVGDVIPLPNMERLSSRIGIATGLVVVGETIGRNSAAEQVVMGETPNLAARLQSLAEPGCIAISNKTRKLAGVEFCCTDLGEHQIKGFSRPEKVWQLVGIQRVGGAEQAFSSHVMSGLQGRDDELSLLQNRWDRACSGTGQVVLLDGEAGIGKSRLLNELRLHSAQSGATQLNHQCSQLHRNTAMYPVTDLLEQRAAIDAADGEQIKLNKLLNLFNLQDALGQQPAAELLSELMWSGVSQPLDSLSITPARRKQLTFEFLLSEFYLQVSFRPLLLVFEDIHWADPTSLELIGLLVKQIPLLPVLLVITHRSEFESPWPANSRQTRLSLSRLSQQASKQIIERLCNGHSLPAEVEQQILDKTDGVPLFVEELIKNVLESDILSLDESGTYHLRGPLEPLSIPSSLNDSLMARLDRAPGARSIAQMAAVIGRDFDRKTIAHVASVDDATLDRCLRQLVTLEIVFSEGFGAQTRFHFKHALVQDAAYGSLLNAAKKPLHASLAQYFIHRQNSAGGVAEEVIAEHLHRAGQSLQAMRYLLQAGQRAIEKFAHTEAGTQLQRCLAIASAAANQDATQAVRSAAVAQTLLGDLAGYRGDLHGANTEYENALDRSADPAIRQWIQRKRHFQHTARCNNAKIIYYTHGDGKRTLLMMNPLAYGLSVFQPLLDYLGQDFKIVTMDCRGTGLSDPLVRPYGINNHMQDVAAVIEALGGEPVIGVGISRGSSILIALAAKYPHLIDKLITVGCPLRMPEWTGKKSFSQEYMRRRIAAYQREDLTELAKNQYDFVYTESGTEEIRKISEQHLLDLPRDTILSFYDPDPSATIVELLPTLKLEALIMHGLEDQLIPVTTSRFLADQIPGASFYGFKNQGHLPMYTATGEFCLQVRRFAGLLSDAQPSGGVQIPFEFGVAE